VNTILTVKSALPIAGPLTIPTPPKAANMLCKHKQHVIYI